MCDASYTVGPQLYQVTVFPSDGMNNSFCLVKLLNKRNFGSFCGGVGACHVGWFRFDIFLTLKKLQFVIK